MAEQVIPDPDFIMSKGYATEPGGGGTIAPNDVFAEMMAWGGGRRYWVHSNSHLQVTPVLNEVGKIKITGGWGGSYGVVDKYGDGTPSASTIVQVATAPPTSDTWFFLGTRHAWGEDQVSSWVVIDTGGNAVVPASRQVFNPSGSTPQIGADDQPVATVRIRKGETVPDAVRDLRLVGAGPEPLANDVLVLDYADWDGSRVRVGRDSWYRGIQPVGGLAWVKEPGPYGRVQLQRIFPFGSGKSGWSCTNADRTDGTTALPYGNLVQVTVQMRNVNDDVTFGGQGGARDHTIANFGQTEYQPDMRVKAINASIVASNGFTYSNVGLRLQPNGDLVLESGPANITIRKDPDDYSLFAHILYTIARAS